MITGTCEECGRVFDLLDEVGNGEYYYGHDCEPPEEEEEEEEGS